MITTMNVSRDGTTSVGVYREHEWLNRDNAGKDTRPVANHPSRGSNGRPCLQSGINYTAAALDEFNRQNGR